MEGPKLPTRGHQHTRVARGEGLADRVSNQNRVQTRYIRNTVQVGGHGADLRQGLRLSGRATAMAAPARIFQFFAASVTRLSHTPTMGATSAVPPASCRVFFFCIVSYRIARAYRLALSPFVRGCAERVFAPTPGRRRAPRCEGRIKSHALVSVGEGAPDARRR